ncbi:MAG: transposase, partial [bacterium]
MGCNTNTNLWHQWLSLVRELRPACSRTRTFLWMTIVLLGLCTRGDLAGVTSTVRAGFLQGDTYRRLLHVFHSTAVDLSALTRCWVDLVLARFQPLEVDGHLLVVADGLKIPKEGRKMPGVKSLHQESQNNSKSEYIMGHSYQAVGLLVEAGGGAACVPLASRLHEGIKKSPSEKATLLDKLVTLFLPLASLLGKPVILLADAYYASQKIVSPLLASGHHLVTRVRSNAVAYKPPPPRPKDPGPGRPRKYGDKVRLRDLWRSNDFVEAPSPGYGENNVTIRLLVQDLLWRPVGCMVRFVLIDHPTRGRLILMTTHTGLDPLEVVCLYALRFKIEVSFKQAVH